MPRAKVAAKPFTVPEPLQNSTRAAISVVTLPSIMADNALLNPLLMADFTVLPRPISSLIRVKIITLASTAMPMDRIMPATPGRVRVISNADSITSTRPTYKASARDAARPGTK